MKLETLNCPSCGASLKVEEDMEFCFCTYCGTRILLKDDNKQTYKYIDAADVKRAETEQLIRLKELEIEEKKRENRKIYIKIWLIVIAALIFLGIIGVLGKVEELSFCFLFAMLVGLYGFLGLMGVFQQGKNDRNTASNESNKVKITFEMADYDDEHFDSMVALYKGAGFTNVTAVPLHDLSYMKRKRNGKVENITIAGKDDFDEDDMFSKRSHVVITYHSMQ